MATFPFFPTLNLRFDSPLIKRSISAGGFRASQATLQTPIRFTLSDPGILDVLLLGGSTEVEGSFEDLVCYFPLLHRAKAAFLPAVV